MASKLQAGIEAVQRGSSARWGLGKLIRDWRKARGLTQTELAKRLGVTPTFMCDVELGRRSLSPFRLGRLQREIDGGSR